MSTLINIHMVRLGAKQRKCIVICYLISHLPPPPGHPAWAPKGGPRCPASTTWPHAPHPSSTNNLGESTDLGNTFWQAHLAKNKKTYLGRGLFKPSTEVLKPQPRFYKSLDRGFIQPSVEVFINPRSRY